jgi:NAD(P)-dependent dehydrogenase (short-subunit alcohol dehydrogenase family)
MKPITKAIAAGTVATVAIRRHRARNRYDFSGRTVVITGGARGLGFALASEFARAGARLVLLSRHLDELNRATQRLTPLARSVDVFDCDVREPRSVNDVIERVALLRGRVDVLVNNAGVIQMMPFEHTPDSDFDDSLRTHFWGPLHLIRACLPHMPTHSRIVNIASIGGRIAVPHLLPYCVGKFALVGLSEGLRAELSKQHIVVTTVTPGLMRTGSHRNVIVRGQHRREAAWFAALTATPITSMNAERAARQILNACRRGDATVTPGWQAKAATIVNAVAPGVLAACMALAVKTVLPSPAESEAGDDARYSRDLDLGPLARVLPTPAAVRLNQTPAADELSRAAAAGRATAAGLAGR